MTTNQQETTESRYYQIHDGGNHHLENLPSAITSMKVDRSSFIMKLQHRMQKGKLYARMGHNELFSEEQLDIGSRRSCLKVYNLLLKSKFTTGIREILSVNAEWFALSEKLP